MLVAVSGLVLLSALAEAGALVLAWHARSVPEGLMSLATFAAGGLAGALGPHLVKPGRSVEASAEKEG